MELDVVTGSTAPFREAMGLAGEDAALVGLVGGETGLTLERKLCIEDGEAEPVMTEAAELTGLF